MKLPQRRVRQTLRLLSSALAALSLAGCGTPRTQEPIIRDPIPPLQVGESIQVELTTGTPQVIPPLNLTISDKGTITFPSIPKAITAAGLRPRELEAIIQSNYTPSIYKDATVTVTIGPRFYYVGGEVNHSENAKQLYTGKVTVLGAISAAGGFTDYAAKTIVQLTWPDGTICIEDCNKALKDPKLDMEVLPGDKINVPRQSLWKAITGG